MYGDSEAEWLGIPTTLFLFFLIGRLNIYLRKLDLTALVVAFSQYHTFFAFPYYI